MDNFESDDFFMMEVAQAKEQSSDLGPVIAASKREASTAAERNVAERGLAEAKTAQACVETLVNANTNKLSVTLPKVCDKYVKQNRPDAEGQVVDLRKK